MTISLLSRSIGPSPVICPIWITGEFLFIPVSRSSSNAANTVSASSDTGSVTRRRKSPLGGSEIFWNVLLSFCSRIRKKNLAMQQTDQTKKQQKRIPQITTRLEQIDKVLNKLYEDNALGTIPQMREEIEEAKKEKSRAYHRQYSREYRARNLEKQREYERIKAREYRARRKAQTAAAQPAL